MDREILFRGKRKDNGEWVEGFYCGESSDSILGPQVEDPNIIKKGSGWWYKVDSYTVSQYTGLQDQNGKRIFEGDVVDAFNFSAEDGYGVIKWDAYTAKFGIIGTAGNDLWADFDNYSGSELGVIGNIYDNRELMEDDHV